MSDTAFIPEIDPTQWDGVSPDFHPTYAEAVAARDAFEQAQRRFEATVRHWEQATGRRCLPQYLPHEVVPADVREWAVFDPETGETRECTADDPATPAG